MATPMTWIPLRHSTGNELYGNRRLSRGGPRREYAAIKFFLRQFQRYPFSVGDPEDIARIALFLTSDEARMITGAIKPADGGLSAH
jgi:NAD(P)-dependent dehydrogenase (short-subunit alcohol dehydrogenase family)